MPYTLYPIPSTLRFPMTPLERALVKILRSPALFSEQIIQRPLRWYQLAPLRAIVHSVIRKQGLTFTLMFARQMGKNETSAHLEIYLMNRFAQKGGSIVRRSSGSPIISPISNSVSLRRRRCRQ